MKRKKGARRVRKLYTEEGRALPAIPWERYPRPQLRRADWLCLNGLWDCSFGGKTRQIRVPFCAESLLSALDTAPAIGEEIAYRRVFSVPDSWRGRRVLLHFGAVSRLAVVTLNGRELCRHDNAYLPFRVDVTEALREVVRFGFEELGLNRIEAQHETSNPASGKVMAHVGMQYEGTLRQRIKNKGCYVDVALYAILRGDRRL